MKFQPAPIENKRPVRADRDVLIQQLSERFSRFGILKGRFRRTFGGAVWLLSVHSLETAVRGLNFVLALGMILLLSPLLFGLWVAAKLQDGGVAYQERLGRWGIVFQEFAFAKGPFRGLPALFNVLKGDMALIGPRPVSPTDVLPIDRRAWRRFNVRPGLICLWWIRQRTNIAYGSEAEADAEYVDGQSLLGDFAIGLRSIPAALYGKSLAVAPDRIDFLGIPIDNLSMEEAVDEILARSQRPVPSQICFVNADCVNVSYRDAAYRQILKNSGLVLADGIGIKLAGKILNTNIRQNVNGTDLFPLLCAEMERHAVSCYLLGGKPGVAAEVANWIAGRFPRLTVSGHHHGFFSPGETPAILNEIRQSGASVLLLAMGAPKQEKWIVEHLPDTGARVALGVGGLFDFYSGRVTRAPIWIREIGMEWFFRFLQEPQRMWRRYFIGNGIFLFRVVISSLNWSASV